ncbi:FadR/GntR family transcriptional regulator [Pseudonocardia sp.]|uniref:FadR/GntR family transcriptional regulator n=1 Tax=Pseudonocardia sp. TaxID=60912 RepID=UPI003D11814B
MTSKTRPTVFEPQARPHLPKMAELVAADIRARIARGELPDGATLPPESELTEHYQVSRPTLREAMRVLESEALIVPRRGSREGARVRAPSIDVAARYTSHLLQYRGATYGDLYQLRLILEPPAAAMLATANNHDALTRLREAYDAEGAALDDTDEYFRRSAHFHELVIELAGLTPLTVFAEMATELMRRQHSQISETPSSSALKNRMRRSHHAHERFLEILDTDTDTAEDAQTYWRDHLQAIGKYYEKRSNTPIELIS